MHCKNVCLSLSVVQIIRDDWCLVVRDLSIMVSVILATQKHYTRAHLAA